MNNEENDEYHMIMTLLMLIMLQIESNIIKNKALLFDYYYVQIACKQMVKEQEKVDVMIVAKITRIRLTLL